MTSLKSLHSHWNNGEPLIPFLRIFSVKLNDWNKQIFHKNMCKKSELLRRLEGIQKALSKGRLNHLLELEAKLRKVMDDVLNREEMSWFQKSYMDAI